MQKKYIILSKFETGRCQEHLGHNLNQQYWLRNWS